jgi:hypothetical protein
LAAGGSSRPTFHDRAESDFAATVVRDRDHRRHTEVEMIALQAGLDLEYSRPSVGFTWEGFDEMDEVSGGGSDELLDDGSIEIEFAYHNRDEAVLNAKRETSSTAC